MNEIKARNLFAKGDGYTMVEIPGMNEGKALTAAKWTAFVRQWQSTILHSTL